MSHGVHAATHEMEHHIQHEQEAHGGGHSGLSDRNKKIALLILVVALFLAISEMFGKSAQTEGLSVNIKASDTWNFFQAKTIRQTTLRTFAQSMTLEAQSVTDEAKKAAMLKQADAWMKTVARYESDPEEKDGRKELRALAEKYEHERDVQFAKYHHYEYASAFFQIAIVLASTAVITGLMVFIWVSMGLSAIGLAIMALGYFNPDYLHHLHLI